MKKIKKKVSILVLEECTPMAPVSIMEILNKTSFMHQQITNTDTPFFETELVAIKNRRVKYSGKFSIDCHTTLDEVASTDIVLIPSLEFDIEKKLERNKSAIPHLLRLHQRGAKLGSMCTGTFMLAATGLLKNKSATTHWYMAQAFKNMYPDVKLEDHKVIVDENGVFSGGGATASLHLGLYLTEKYCGKETANMASRMLLMDSNKASQTQFSMFIPQSQHNDEAIQKAQQTIEQDHDQKINVEELAEITNLSKRSFIRRFKAATGNTPIEYIQRMNVEKAKRQLEKTQGTIEQIIYSLGYSDTHSFRKIFSRYTNLTPKEYRDRYSLS